MTISVLYCQETLRKISTSCLSSNLNWVREAPRQPERRLYTTLNGMPSSTVREREMLTHKDAGGLREQLFLGWRGRRCVGGPRRGRVVREQVEGEGAPRLGHLRTPLQDLGRRQSYRDGPRPGLTSRRQGQQPLRHGRRTHLEAGTSLDLTSVALTRRRQNAFP